jgi:hypothetical protein
MRASDGKPEIASGNDTLGVASGEIVEFILLLPLDHFSILERLAEGRGTVIARLLRHMIWDFLVSELRLGPASETQPGDDPE